LRQNSTLFSEAGYAQYPRDPVLRPGVSSLRLPKSSDQQRKEAVMSTPRKSRWLTVAIALLGAVAGTLWAPEADAQIRPAYVKNVDEPGRIPYEECIEFSVIGCSSLNCSNYNSLGTVSLFDGPAVPAGKRLIVQRVSGRLPNNTGDGVSVALQGSQIVSMQSVKWVHFGPYFSQLSMIGFGAEAFATYGPGQRPHVNVVLPDHNNFIGFVTISGYLIDATN
jgi:hypothetical protein